MKEYRIDVNGCDDSTTIKAHLSDAEAALIKKIAESITEASNGVTCKPTMEIEINPVVE